MNLVENKRSRYRNQAAGRVLAVLCAFIGHDRPRGVTELAAELGFNKNMVHRALATLTSENFVTRDATGALYQLGYRWLALDIGEVTHVGIVAPSRPHLGQVPA